MVVHVQQDCRDYSIFRIGVDRKHEVKWFFPFRGPRGQVFVRGVEVKATFLYSRKVYVYSENALVRADEGS
jgi:hypothetical protein